MTARPPADIVFVLFILTATWGCGRLVRRRTERAAHAAATAAELAARDPAAVAARVVAEERARLAGDALDVIRRAVERMRDHARAAEAGLDRAPLVAIQDEGRAAVAELRRLLGLLRRRAGARRRPEPRPATAAGPARAAGGGAALMALAVVDVVAWYSGARPGGHRAHARAGRRRWR